MAVGSGAVELGVGYVSVIPSAKGFQKELDKQLAGASAGAAGAGEKVGKSMSSGMSKALKVGGAAAGAAAVAGIGVAITKGFGRLNQIDQARAKLSGLGHEAGNVEKIMDSALTAVKGTAFGMGDAATVAAATVAAGVKPGQELERTLKLMGDAATIAGTDMATMGSIVNKVATSDMMQMDVANQLMDAGIPILQMVADEMGVTAGEARKLASEGKVSFETFQNALDAGLGGAALKSGETLQGSLNNLMASVGRLGEAMLKPFLGEGKGLISSLTGLTDMLTNKVGPAMEGFIKVMGDAYSWLKRNQDWLGPLAVGLGTVAAGFALVALQQKIVVAGGFVKWLTTMITSTKIATGVTAAWNAVMAANPIALVVIAVAALAAGLTYFFTKTETGQRVWSNFMAALEPAKKLFGDLIDFGKMIVDILFKGDFNGNAPFGIEEDSGVVNFLFTLRDTVISVWNAIKSAFTAAGSVIQGIFTAWKVAIGVVLTAALLLWEGIKAYWTMIGNIIVWAWDTLIAPTFDLLKSGLDAVGAFFSWVWTGVIQPVWNALGAGIRWVYDAVIFPAWEAMKAALGAVGAFFQWVWNSVISPAWTALGAGINFVWLNVINPTWEALKAALGVVGTFFQNTWNNVIKPAWDALGKGIQWVADNVVHPVFDGLKRGLDLVKSAFRTAVDIIGTIWNEIKEKAAAPIRFVIDTVYNNGIVSVWNKVAGWVGLDDKKLEPMKINFASGGVLPGYTPGRDPYTFIEPSTGMQIGLSGGEAILRPEATRALGTDRVDSINAAARMGGVSGVRRELGNFAGGGVIGSISGLVNKYFPGMSITSTLRPGDPGHHGSGNAVDFSNGTDTTPQMQAAARFFHDNYAPGLYELIHWPLNGWQNIKNGSPLNYGDPTNSQHRNHVHVAAPSPLGPPGSDIVPIQSGSAGTGGGVLRRLAEGVFSQIIDPLLAKIPSGGGLWGEMPRGFADKTVGIFKDFVMSKLPGGGSSANGDWVGSPGVEQFRPLVEKLLKEKGQPLSLVGSVLRRMNQESGGDPNAINLWDSNAAAGIPSKGLMQTIDPTFQAFKDPGFDNIWDPEANLRASMNYAMSKYGGLAAAYDRPGGYHNGGLAPAGEGWLPKTALEPEFVLNPAMTEAFIDWMRGTPQGESAAALAKELASAFADLVASLQPMAELVASEIGKMSATFESTWRDGMLEDAAGVFGLGQVGGVVGAAMDVASDPEVVKAREAWDANQGAWLNKMVAEQVDRVEQFVNGGATYNVYANDLDEAMKRLRLREAQRAQTYMGAR